MSHIGAGSGGRALSMSGLRETVEWFGRVAAV